MAGARSRKAACSPHCSRALKKQYDHERQKKVKSGEIIAVKTCGTKPREVRTCSNCGAVMGSGHIKFGRECRAKAGAPAYVTIKPRSYEFMEVVNGRETIVRD